MTIQGKRGLNSKRFKGVYVWNAFETRFKQFQIGFKQFQIVSNTRRLKCNKTRLHVFQTPDLLYSCQQLKFISGTNIIIQQKSRMVTVFENKNCSFNNEVEAKIKIKIKEINLIIQFYNKAKIFLLFDVKSVYISCTPRKQCNNRKKHVSQISHEITSMCWCKIRQHMHIWNTFVRPFIVYLSHLFVPKELKKLCFSEGWIQLTVNDPCCHMSRNC